MPCCRGIKEYAHDLAALIDAGRSSNYSARDIDRSEDASVQEKAARRASYSNCEFTKAAPANAHKITAAPSVRQNLRMILFMVFPPYSLCFCKRPALIVS